MYSLYVHVWWLFNEAKYNYSEELIRPLHANVVLSSSNYLFCGYRGEHGILHLNLTSFRGNIISTAYL